MQWFNETEHREQQICDLRDEARVEYPSLWRRVVSEWRAWEGADSAWLTYSANYLLSTAGYLWAMDPFHLSSRLTGIPEPSYIDDLRGLSLVVLTHAHSDHLDRKMVHALAESGILWVIPEHMREEIEVSTKIPGDRIITPRNGIPIQAGPVTLTPFEGLHYRDQNGVPETGYLVEFNNTRWLFPGDIRTYDSRRLPSSPDLDGLMAHLWLGKESASEDIPPLLDEFCNFCKDVQPAQTVVTHLYELGRDEHDLWDLRHYYLVKNKMMENWNENRIHCAMMGDRVSLEKC